MKESQHEKTGIEEFIEASDEFYSHLAQLIRTTIEGGTADVAMLREISEIVRINSNSIKMQQEKTAGKKSPMDKIKARSSTGQQVVA